MTKTLSLVLALGVVAVAMPALGDTIRGSKHDLSTSGWDPGSNWQADNVDQVCIFCHTPHQTSDAGSQYPLWNHTLSDLGYATYTSDTMVAPDKGTPIDPPAVGSATITHLCMSCHDGTIGVGSLYNNPNMTVSDTIGPEVVPQKGGADLTPLGNNANLGTSLADDHPVNFTYTDKDGLHPKTDLEVSVLLDGDGKMHCSSCHSSHDPQFVPFLVKSNSESALCLTCHDEFNLDATHTVTP